MSENKIQKTESEWKEQLTPEQYHVTREHGTERAFSSPLDKFYETGSYSCVCCDNPLFVSDTKFDSGCGWPSFFKTLGENAVTEHEDNSFYMRRVEIRCGKCEAHLGHVFNDGPPPTGLRYCMNGVALNFTPKEI